MDREAASGTVGSSGYIDGLVRRWTQAGYIVVCPTHRKRLIPGTPFWEWAYNYENIPRMLTDILRVRHVDPEEYFLDRLRDIRFLADNLDTILNGKAAGCYDPDESKLGIAGHSMGAITTLIAAGAELTAEYKPLLQSTQTVTIDPEQHGFSRVESGPSPFIDAVAFIAISGGHDATTNGLTVFDETRPGFHGKDFIQRPLMTILGGSDVVHDGQLWAWQSGFQPENADWMNPVLKAYGLNDAPAYGVVVDGANHSTAITQFTGVPSWDIGTLWNQLSLIIQPSPTKLLLGAEDQTIEEKMRFTNADIATALIHCLEGMFPTEQVTELQEVQRLEVFERYTRRFWDVYLSPRYDEENNGEAKAFLYLDQDVHTGDDGVLDVYGYARSSPGAFVVRDLAGDGLVQFQNDGHVLVLKGSITTGATIAQTSAQEFIIRDTTGTIAAKVDAATGNFYLKGLIEPKATDLRTSSSPEFVVRDAVEIAQPNNADKARVIVDANGNLKRTGEVIVHTP